MTRVLAFLFLVVIVYFLARNVIRGILRGLNLGNKNNSGKNGRGSTKDYRDVQDADFKDITDDK